MTPSCGDRHVERWPNRAVAIGALGITSVGLLLALTTSAPEPARSSIQEEPMSTTADRPSPTQTPIQSGSWQGEYLDTYGHRAALRLELEVSGDNVRGRYDLRVRTEDAPQMIRGELEGRLEGDRVRFAAIVGKEGRRVEFDAVVRPAGSHARQAMFGVVRDAPQPNFGGGIWMAWRFTTPADRAREREAERGSAQSTDRPPDRR
jgi:hypothetical protein